MVSSAELLESNNLNQNKIKTFAQIWSHSIFVRMLSVLSVIAMSPLSSCRWPQWWRSAWWRVAAWWWATSCTETKPTFSGWSSSVLRSADRTWTLSWMRYTIWERTCDEWSVSIKSLSTPLYSSAGDGHSHYRHHYTFSFFLWSFPELILGNCTCTEHMLIHNISSQFPHLWIEIPQLCVYQKM